MPEHVSAKTRFMPDRLSRRCAAAVVVGLAPMIWFAMRKVVGMDVLPGFESRINYSWEVYTLSLIHI